MNAVQEDAPSMENSVYMHAVQAMGLPAASILSVPSAERAGIRGPALQALPRSGRQR